MKANRYLRILIVSFFCVAGAYADNLLDKKFDLTIGDWLEYKATIDSSIDAHSAYPDYSIIVDVQSMPNTLIFECNYYANSGQQVLIGKAEQKQRLLKQLNFLKSQYEKKFPGLKVLIKVK